MIKNFKSLFIADEEGTKDNKNSGKPSAASTKFPNVFNSDTTTTNQTISGSKAMDLCMPYMDKTMELYEKGFESLNMEGYDFFEFFQAVVNAGTDNPLVYKMAMNMGISMNKSITKEKLVSQAEHYVREINKVHEKNVNTGNLKKSEVLNQKENEHKNLTTELESLKFQREQLNVKIKERETQLANIDNKFENQIDEINCKLMANDYAKNKILSSMQHVLNGIKNHI